MRWLAAATIIGLLLAAAILTAVRPAHGARECLSLSEARRTGHGHPRYRVVNGRRCWYTNRRRSRSWRQPLSSSSPTELRPEDKVIPLPPTPDETPAAVVVANRFEPLPVPPPENGQGWQVYRMGGPPQPKPISPLPRSAGREPEQTAVILGVWGIGVGALGLLGWGIWGWLRWPRQRRWDWT